MCRQYSKDIILNASDDDLDEMVDMLNEYSKIANCLDISLNLYRDKKNDNTDLTKRVSGLESRNRYLEQELKRVNAGNDALTKALIEYKAVAEARDPILVRKEQ